jgi:hypothetical protein
MWRGIGTLLNWVPHITMPWALRSDHPTPPLMIQAGLMREGRRQMSLMAEVAGATCGQLNGTAAIRLSHPRLLSGTKPEPSIW